MLLRFMIAALGFAGTTFGSVAQEPTSSGTGFFVNSGGWLVTNRHVVDQCARVEIKGFGVAERVIEHPDHDLALLRTDGSPSAKPVKLRVTSPKLGEEIVTLGYPLAGFLSDTIKITTGNINSLEGIGNDPFYLQISAPIQPGNSGGPLIDRTGAVIGVNSATIPKELSDAIGYNLQNINFSIRIGVVRRFLSREGLAFDEADADAPEIGTAEIAEAVQPSTVQVLCYGGRTVEKPPVTEPARSEPSTATTDLGGELREAFGYDALGFDLAALRNVSYEQCKRECVSDASCRALTYNTRYDACFLKSKALILVRNGDAATAYDSRLAADLLITDFSVYANTDAPGGDYLRLRDADFVGCTVACMKDSQCRAFAYVKKTHDCWLKDRIGAIRDMQGVEFGIK